MRKPTILGEWVHAHERDKAGAQVYVEAGQPLPPSRGRHRLQFLPDGTFVEQLPGANDRTSQTGGVYELDGATLVLHRRGLTSPMVYQTTLGSDGKSVLLKKVREPG